MGFLDLIEKYHLVRPPSNYFSERSALLITNITRGAPISREIECFSMYSDISRRTNALSSSKRYWARVFVTSLTNSVGPKNRKLPKGLVSLFRPALARLTTGYTFYSLLLSDNFFRQMAFHL